MASFLDALIPFVDACDALGIAYYIGGSVASITHGVPRTPLDLAYLRRWATELGIADLLEQLRRLDLSPEVDDQLRGGAWHKHGDHAPTIGSEQRFSFDSLTQIKTSTNASPLPSPRCDAVPGIDR